MFIIRIRKCPYWGGFLLAKHIMHIKRISSDDLYEKIIIFLCYYYTNNR